MNCPQCQQSLSPAPAGRRLSCSFCGWVEPPPADEPLARKAEEIARERQLDSEPVWRYLLMGLGVLTLLVVSLNAMVGSFQKKRPSQDAEGPLPSLSAPPMSGGADQSATPPQMAAQSAQPGSGSGNVAGSVDPLAQASAQASGVAAAANAAENGQPLPAASGSGLPVPSGSPGAVASPAASASASLAPGETISPAASPSLAPGATVQPIQIPSGVLITPPPEPSATPR